MSAGLRLKWQYTKTGCFILEADRVCRAAKLNEINNQISIAPCGHNFSGSGRAWSTCPGSLPGTESSGVDPATCWLQAERPNHYRTTAHRACCLCSSKRQTKLATPPDRLWARIECRVSHTLILAEVSQKWLASGPSFCFLFFDGPDMFVFIHCNLLLLLRLTPLVRSATGRQQPSEWSVLGQVDCVGPWQPGSRGRSASSSSRSSAVVLVVSSNTQKARKWRSALRLHCRPFGRYARIGLDAVPG